MVKETIRNYSLVGESTVFSTTWNISGDPMADGYSVSAELMTGDTTHHLTIGSRLELTGTSVVGIDENR